MANRTDTSDSEKMEEIGLYVTNCEKHILDLLICVYMLCKMHI